jgi:N-methylhydantoinase A
MRIGVDIGGTFTDFTLVEGDGTTSLWKEATTPSDYTEAIRRGLKAVAEQRGTSVPKLLRDTEMFVHGTTIATNTVIQERGARVGLLCTEGFRDVLHFRDGFKPERFNIHRQHPAPIVPRHLRLAVRERMTPDGAAEIPIEIADVEAAAEQFREAGVEAVAIAFLWSVVNPDHEREAASRLRELLPSIPVICSSEVLPEIREWERTSAAALSAYILPRINDYLGRLEEQLKTLGLGRQLLLMQVNGGCASPDEILARPVYALASGPAAAPAAARVLTDRLGLEDALVVDMGGTSLDVTLVQGGRARTSRTMRVADQPIGVAGVEVLSVGAGGGSIAWIDDGGALRVGPDSAGADPGPACYGLGGVLPTVTDANVLAGYLSPDAFLGGRHRLDVEAAERAIEDRVARPLKMSVDASAGGILRVVNANMVGAIRSVSVERGIDPRALTMIVGGGAGGLHAAAMARSLGMSRAVIPPQAGALCAFGMTVTDVQHDYVAPHYATSRTINLPHVQEMLSDLRTKAVARLSQEGFAKNEISVEYAVDARYPGQVNDLIVSLGSSAADEGLLPLDGLEDLFHSEHQREFSYARPGVHVEFLHWRVKGIGRTRERSESRGLALAPQPDGSKRRPNRRAYFEEYGGFVDTSVIDGTTLVPGSELRGPAIIEKPTTTIAVGPWDTVQILDDSSVQITVGSR